MHSCLNIFLLKFFSNRLITLSHTADHQIMSHLLAHEGKESINSAQPVTEEEPEYSSSSDENSAAGTFIAEVEEDSSEEEEFTVRVSHIRTIIAQPEHATNNMLYTCK